MKRVLRRDAEGLYVTVGGEPYEVRALRGQAVTPGERVKLERGRHFDFDVIRGDDMVAVADLR